MARRVVTKGSGRRTVATKDSGSSVELDDRPLSLRLSRDGKRAIVCLPYEACVVNVASLDVEKTTELTVARPSVFEGDEDGVLLFGGAHLHRGSLWSNTATKIGTKLGGVVDRICVVRPRLLCGVGSTGEVLWDTEREREVHRRKVSERDIIGLGASADGRAVFADGRAHAWIIDPDHASGYKKLSFKCTSPTEVVGETIAALDVTRTGRCILASRDGGVAWTNRALRVVGERFVGKDDARVPLDVDADRRWVYVLRTGGVLHRFRIETPADDEPDPLPPAQSVRLPRAASCLCVRDDGSLLLAGPHSDNQLGRLWSQPADALEWAPLTSKSTRPLVEAAAEATAPAKPDFTQVRSKPDGAPISQTKVDDVIATAPKWWITRGAGVAVLERPTATRAPADVLPGDALLLPAMLRLREGTARPGLVVWPGAPVGRRRGDPVLLAWGDEPREWLVLDTPSIRKQGWSRRDVFPMQVALPQPPPDVAGDRPRLPTRWSDPELFTALVKECKKMLKVLW